MVISQNAPFINPPVANINTIQDTSIDIDLTVHENMRRTIEIFYA